MKYELEKCLYLLNLLEYEIDIQYVTQRYHRYNLIKNRSSEKTIGRVFYDYGRQNIIDMALYDELDNHDESRTRIQTLNELIDHLKYTLNFENLDYFISKTLIEYS